jgi:hypothetical protein
VKSARLLFALALIILLSACSNSGSSDTSNVDTTSSSIVEQSTTLPLSEEPPRWDVVPGPPIPTVTDPVPEDGVFVGANVFWAQAAPVVGDQNNAVVFVLSQFFSGEECIKYVTSIGIDPESGDACPNDYTVRTEPRAVMSISSDATVTVTYVETQESRLITTEILQRLIRGEEPLGTPTDFDYTPFPFVVSTIDGVIVSAQQVWVP